MNIGLVTGKKNSVGIPGKNLRKILGRPSAEYAFIAAKYAKLDQIFVSTDCNKIIRRYSYYLCMVLVCNTLYVIHCMYSYNTVQ